MLEQPKIGVLFSDDFMSNEYHIMLANGEVVRTVLLTDRTVKRGVYECLYLWCKKLHINRLWVHPDNMLSTWVMKSDFDSINQTLDTRVFHWTTPGDQEDGHPKGIRMWVHGDNTRWVFFPAHIDMTSKHQFSKIKMGTWSTPSPDHLYNTVDYLERATEHPLLWSPAYSSKGMLRDIHHGKDIVAFIGSDQWDSAYKKMVVRPCWIHRNKDGARGLSPDQLQFKYFHGLDKNVQFLGGCMRLNVPYGDVIETPVAGNEYHPDKIGFWEYQILDVADSMFNSYDCYCPLDLKRTWASTQVIHFALQAGIKLDIKQGMVFTRETSGRILERWAQRLWNGRVALNNQHKYPDSIAADNAQNSIKKYYIDMIGQFCAEYSNEYYHKEWNTLIVHNAIANQGYTLLLRQEDLKGRVVLVVNDAMYILSNEQDIYKALPGLLKHQQHMSGYKPIGTCEVTPDVVEVLADKKVNPVDVESYVKGKMVKYRATI